MKDKKKLGTKLLFYFGGLIIMTFGVMLSVKSDLGVTPISSIPYTATVVSGMDLGIATMLFSALMVLLQVIVLGKQYKIINLLQLPISLLFGVFLTLSGQLMGGIPVPEHFLARFLLMLVSTVFVAAGVFLYVSPGFVPLSPEGFIIAVSQATRKKFSSVKVIFDVTMVIISLLTCLITVRSAGSVGIGTLAAAVLVGNEVKLLNRLLGKQMKQLLGSETE